MTLFAPFLINATLAGLGVMLAAAPLGCFVVWRRMAYFGDAIAHGAILGVALSLAFSVSIFGGVLVVTLALALAVSGLAGRGVAVDTLLGVLAHAALAFGLVAVSLVPGVRVDLSAYLFGDILAVSRTDLWVIWGGAGLVLGVMVWRWQRLLLATLDTDLAIASGVRPSRERLILMLSLALVVAVALKVVGALLISALLIIPAAAARPWVALPERMAFLAAILGVIAVLAGLAVSFQADTPAGPTIVAVAAIVFAVTNVASLFRKAR
ncbi:MAG TPA: hypothetical protein ENK28_14980 [Aliiroseovarius sp.]|nr:hypothetical protein [Aliiroseovarius sp.]